MSDTELGIDPNMAFEHAYPGLSCLYALIRSEQYFNWSADAAAEMFIAHGILTAEMVESLPPSGSAWFGPRPRKPERFAPLQTYVLRKRDGQLRVRQFTLDDAAAVAALREKLGLAAPNPNAELERAPQSPLEAPSKPSPAPPVKMTTHERPIGRFQTPRRWAVCGKLIFVDWSNVRARC